ncbi:MAG: TonB-dependent receptor [Acidobacteriaceae bacterium]
MSKFFKMVSGCFLLPFLLVALSASMAVAQSERGSLVGNVTDQTGAVIPNASVTATNQATSGKSVTKSTSAGVYRFPALPVGTYTVAVTAPGFATKTSTGIDVQVNGTAAVNVTLLPGSVTEVVTVDASGLRLQTQTSDIGGTISQKQIQDLPLSLAGGVGGLRSPETFAFLVPGTTGPGTGGSAPFQGNGVFLSKLSGGQDYGAEVLLDGASIQRSENGSSFDETSPSIEALREFKVTTSTPSAEFGRTTSGIESFVTKSGTNQYHGTAYTIVKNAAFDANNWFNNGYQALNCANTPENQCAFRRGSDSKYDYGGTLGGPVRIPKIYDGKDKTFFFFAWEQYKLHQGAVTQSTVPTASGGTTGNGEVGGDFSQILGGPTAVINPCTGQPVLQNQIFDPSTTNATVSATNPNGIPCRLPFAGNIIPTASFSPAAVNLMQGLPAPNQTATPNPPYGFFNNYSMASVVPTENTTYTVRIDQNISENSKAFGSYSSRDNFSLHGAPTLPEPFNNGGYFQDFETHYGRAGWDYTFSPTLLNHLNLGYNRTNSNNISQSFQQSRSATSAGVPNEHSTAYPVVNWDGLDSFTQWGQQQNGDNIDNGVRVNDSVVWQKGRNSFTFGADWRHQQYSTIQLNINNLNFLRSETDVAALGGIPQFQSGNSFASFLLGEVDNAGQTVYNHSPRWNSRYSAFFVEDDMKVSSNLTLNLGLRYSIDVPRKEASNKTSNFSFTAPDPAADGMPGALEFGVNCHCNTAWADTWYKDIAPRLGFAYVLPGTNGKVVLRGGGALIYGPLQYNDFGSSMTAGYTIGRGIGSFFTGPGTAAGFTPAFQLDSGYPATSFAPNLDPGQLTAVNGPGSFTAVGGEVIVPKDGRPSMTSNWSLQLQDELAQDLIFSIGYIGQSAQNLRSGDLTNFNNINPKYFSYGDHLSDPSNIIPLGGSSDGVNAPYPSFTGELGQALRPYPQYDYIQGDCCLENLGHSSYDAMVVSLNRRFRQGFNLQVSYTWSKNITDADSTIPFSYIPQATQGESSGDLLKEKAVSLQNIPQALSISYLVQLPFGKGHRYFNHNRLADFVIGGWQVGAIQRYQSGQPMPFGCATGIPYYQNCIKFSRGPAAAGGGFASAAYKNDKNGPSVFNGESWFKPAYRAPGTLSPTDPGTPMADAAFVDVNREGPGWLRTPSPSCPDGCSYDPFAFPTGIPRVTEEITGPIYKAEDFSLIKNFPITERVKFQFEAEAFDIFNRHRMGFPDLEPADYTGTLGFGIPGAVDYGPRNLQVTGRINF